MHREPYRVLVAGLVLLFILVLRPLFTLGQSTCLVNNIDVEIDAVELERQLPNCHARFDEWKQQFGTIAGDKSLPALIRAQYYLFDGLIDLENKDYPPARQQFMRAFEQAQKATGTRTATILRYAYYYAGYASIKNTSKYESGADYLDTAYRLASRDKDYLITGRVLLLRALQAYANKNLDVARAQFYDALANFMMEANRSIPEQIDTLVGLAQVEDVQGHYSLERLYSLQSESLRANPDLYKDMAILLGNEQSQCSVTNPQDEHDYFTLEKKLINCPETDIDSLISKMEDAIEQKPDVVKSLHLKTVLGILYFVNKQNYDAYTIHGENVEQYFDTKDNAKVALNFFYMARSYAAAKRDEPAKTYFNEAITYAEKEIPDFYIAGLAHLGFGKYLFEQNNDSTRAVFHLEKAFEGFQKTEFDTSSEQLDTARLLNQIYLELGQEQDAERFETIIHQLAGKELKVSNSTIVNYGDPFCRLNNLYSQWDALYVERQMHTCENSVPSLMLTAMAMYYSAPEEDHSTRGASLLYIGLGHYVRENYVEASKWFSRSVDELKSGDFYLLRGPAYVYLILAYYHQDKVSDAEKFLNNLNDLKNNSFDLQNYYGGVIEFYRGRNELDRTPPNYQVAASYLSRSFELIEISGIPSHDLLFGLAQTLIIVYSKINNQESNVELWQEKLDNLRNPAPTIQPTLVEPSSIHQTQTSCDEDSIVQSTDLIDAEQLLIKCDKSLNLEIIIWRVQSTRQRSSDIVEQLRLQNLEGIVLYHNGDYLEAWKQHNGVLRAYQLLENAPPIDIGRTNYYLGRTLISRGLRDDGLRFIQAAKTQATKYQDYLGLAFYSEVDGQTSYESGSLDNAVQFFSMAASNFEKADRKQYAVPLLLTAAELNDQRSHFAVSQRDFQYAIAIATSLKDARSVVRGQLGVARYNKYVGHFDEALVAIAQAESFAETDEDKALLVAEKADIERENGNYETARAIYQTLNVDQYPCEVGDIIRLYKGSYWIEIGQTADAITTFSSIISSDCEGRSWLIRTRAFLGVADARLRLRETNQQVLDAVNASITQSHKNDGLDFPRGYQTARIQEARFEAGRRNFDKAEDSLVVAEELAIHPDGANSVAADFRGLADIALVRVDIDIANGQFLQAQNNMQIAEEFFNKIGHQKALLNTLGRRLQINLNQADFKSAETIVQDAKTKYGGLSVNFDGLINFYDGQILEQQGKTFDAQVAYNSAWSLLGEAGAIISQMDVDFRRVALLHRVGDYVGGQDYLNKLNDFVIQQDSDYYSAEYFMLLGNNLVLNWINRKVNTPVDTNLESDDAQKQNEINDLLLAEQNYLRAYEFFNHGGLDAGIAEAQLRLGELGIVAWQYQVESSELKSKSEAKTYLSEAWIKYRLLQNSLGQSEALYDLGRYYIFNLSKGDDREGVKHLNAALAFILGNSASEENVIATDPYRLALIHTYLGLAYEKLKEFGNAILEYEKATELLSVAYAEINDPASQQTFGSVDTTLLAYNRLVRLYAEGYGGQSDEKMAIAFTYAEQSRARSYLMQLQRSSVDFSQIEGGKLLKEWSDIRAEITRLNRQYTDYIQIGDSEAAQVLYDQLQVQRDHLEVLREKISPQNLSQFLTINVYTAEQVEDTLSANSAMISYYVLPSENGITKVVIFLVTSKGTQTKIIEFEKYEERISLVGNFYDWNNSSNFELSETFYHFLVEPIREALNGYTNLIIVPSAAISYIPFELLKPSAGTDPNYQSYLVKYFTIHYAPSATVYGLLQQTVPKKQGNSALIMGYSGEGDYRVTPLDNVHEEIEDIRQYFSETVIYPDEEAIASNLKDLDNYDVIHFVAHGIFSQSDPLRSEILIAPSGQTLHGLWVSEVYNLDLQARHPLITISACDLAINKLNPGDELEGFARAFLLTGARGIVASLWKVDTAATEEFMQNFYRLRSEGKNNAQALAETKRFMIEHTVFTNPAFWAGFILVGVEY